VFGLGPATRVYLAVGATDLRKGFEGLFGLVKDRLGLEPLERACGLFLQPVPKPDQVVVLGRLGPLVLRKTLGKGPFQMADGVRWLGASAAQSGGVDLVAGGIDLKQTKTRTWYRKTVLEGKNIEKEAGN
jgi:transposase